MLSFLFLIVGFIAQFIDGTLGMGYGVSSSTLLISVGIVPVIASASVHTAEVFVSIVSGASHLKLGNVRKDIFLPITFSGILGGVIGAYGLVNIPTKPIRIMVGAVLFVMGCIIFYRFIFKTKTRKLPESFEIILDKKYSKKKLALLGFFGAIIDAIGGGGWGPICTPSLVITGTDPRKAVGPVNLAEIFVTIAEVATFIIFIGLESFRWDIVIPLLIAGFVAAPIAALTCKRLPQRTLGALVGLSVIVLSTRILLKTFGVF